MTPGSWIALLVVLFSASGCRLTTAVDPPTPSEVTELKLSLERDDLSADYRVRDRASIDRILAAYSSLDGGWRTAEYLAWTRGWFTTPTILNSVVFLNKEHQAFHVLWFDEHLVCARTISDDGHPDGYRKPSDELLAALREAEREPL